MYSPEGWHSAQITDWAQEQHPGPRLCGSVGLTITTSASGSFLPSINFTSTCGCSDPSTLRAGSSVA